jgi:hypothetical protein
MTLTIEVGLINEALHLTKFQKIGSGISTIFVFHRPYLGIYVKTGRVNPDCGMSFLYFRCMLFIYNQLDCWAIFFLLSNLFITYLQPAIKLLLFLHQCI